MRTSLPKPINGLDLKWAMQNVHGDRRLLRRLARLFVEEAPAMLTALRQAASERQLEELARAAHRIRGSVAYFGATAAASAAERVERLAAEAGGGVADSAEAVDELSRRLHELLGLLQQELLAEAR